MHNVLLHSKVCPLVREQCLHRPRRAIPARLIVYAGDKREKLQNQITSTSQALGDAVEALQERLSNSQQPSRDSGLAGRDQQLWDRQGQQWEREIARWDMERAAWDAKEIRLMDQISLLQSQIVSLSSQSMGPISPQLQYQNPAPPNQTAQGMPGPMSEPIPASAQLSQPAQGLTASEQRTSPQQPLESPPQTSAQKVQTATQQIQNAASVLEQASQFLPPEDDRFEQPKSEQYQPLNVAVDTSSSDPAVESVRHSLQAAFSAVDNEDILYTSFDDLRYQGPGTMSQQRSADSNLIEASPAGYRQDSANSIGPPSLSIGADDIFWMSKLHEALTESNLFPGEEDMDNWLFADGTLSAVLTYQALNGLPETGVVDDATWEKLLGPDYKSIHPPSEPEDAPTAAETSFQSISSAADSPATSLITPSTASTGEGERNSEMQQLREMRATSELQNRKRNDFDERPPMEMRPTSLESWPVLREGDGGKKVHYLQIALERKGFISDIDDQRWWFFGSSTFDCVLSFQACSYLPETGVVETATWKALMGEDASPESLAELTNEFEDDLTDDTERHWLLGEQRWELRKK